MALFTVIIPVLNGMPFLREALASLEAQTFRDFEVLLWDNGSTDRSVEESLKWIPSRLPGRVVSDSPLPLHECLARMVEESGTEFCARLDADDVCHPERFEMQLKAMRSDPRLVALGTQAAYIDETGKKTGEKSSFPLHTWEIACGMLVENQLLHPTVMCRRQVILDAGNYSIAKPCEDYDLWMRVSQHGLLANLPETLLSYRIHPLSIISSARRENQLEEPNLRCIEALSSQIFDIPNSIYRKLRRKEHPLACLPLLRAARRISNRTHVPTFSILRSRKFLWSARCLTAHSDLLSRAFWGALQRFCQIAPQPVSRSKV